MNKHDETYHRLLQDVLDNGVESSKKSVSDKKVYYPIPNYPNYYVTKCGEVFSYKTKKYYQLKPDKSAEYCRVTLYKNNKRTRVSTHRLIALVFLKNPNNLPIINHKNGVKTDNRLENLEWCSYSENCKHALRTGLAVTAVGEAYERSNLKNKDIILIRKMWKTKKFEQKELAKKFKTTRENINNIVNYYTWRHLK